jgi:4-hydroxy-2-oxoheptanedioate aldolase
MKQVEIPSLESVKHFKSAMDSERGAFGPFMISTDPAFVEAAGYAGYDFVLLDMEHGTTTFEQLPNLIRAANVTGVCPVVRVPRGSDIWIDQALDVGAGAVMIPQIDTADQARAAVSAAKFSPVGTRGTCRFVRSAGFGSVPGNRYFADAQNTCVILQAEGKKAVDNIDEIMAVPGIDVIFVGPYDLSSSLGHVGEIDHPEVTACIKSILAKAEDKGIKIGCFADNVESGKHWRDLGVRFIGYSCDTNIFLQGALRDIDEFSKTSREITLED